MTTPQASRILMNNINMNECIETHVSLYIPYMNHFKNPHVTAFTLNVIYYLSFVEFRRVFVVIS